MSYCVRCRIGTLDAQGLCVLCGAPQTPPTARRRALDVAGGALGALLNPLVVGALVFAALAVAAAVVSQGGAHAPAGVPRMGLGSPLDVRAALATGRSDPWGTALRLLAPAMAQALLFALLLTVLVLVWRFWQARAPKDGRELPRTSG